MSEATYLYCLVRDAQPPALAAAPAGLPGCSPPQALEVTDGLWLVTARAPLPAYGGEEIERRLTGLDGWTREGDSISKTFDNDDFVGSVEFVRRLTGPAEEICQVELAEEFRL